MTPVPAPSVIIVEGASNHQSYAMLGFIASGSPASLACIESISTGSSLQVGRTQGPNNVPEVMLVFRPGSGRESQLAVYQSARAGTCTGAKLEVVVVPVDALKNGAGLDQATVENPEFIKEPKS